MSIGFRAKTATFNSVNMTDLTQFNISQGGQSHDLVGDASADILSVFVDSIATDVTVSSNDIGLSGNAGLEVGDSASLVVVFEKRASGRAAAGSGDKTLTLANCVCVSKTAEANTNGIGSGSFVFRAPGQATWS